MVFNHKVKVILKTLRSIFWSFMFNIRYLPFKQAYKLPILVYKPCFLSLKGEIIIDTPTIKTGMIRLGWDSCSLYYPNNRYGIIFENHGGTIIFKGKAIVGSGSAISVGPKGWVEFGDNFIITANARIVGFKKIKFGDNFTGGWELIIMDTNLHRLINIETDERTEMSGEIIIGNDNWFASRCIVQKGTNTPDGTTLAMQCLINKKYTPPYCIFGDKSMRVIKKGYYLDNNSHEQYD